jgi:gamma-glutamyltranspeptidase/glutathione hydrolase
MRIAAAVVIAGSILMQQPAGDRPWGNSRGTRSAVLARNGAIATSQPLATAAGLRVLQSGGNAIDAAVTAAAVLSVVEPTMNGPGGDLFAIVYSAKDRKVHGLNASGRAPSAATLDEFKKRNLQRIPLRGPLSVSVPGVVDGWNELLTKHGTRTLAQALEPAIKYARDGYAVSEIIAGQWKDVEGLLARDPAAARTFLINGKTPAAGEIFRNPALANSLEKIARGGRDVFYTGAIAKAIAADMQHRDGGLITLKDLADHHADWVEPLSTTYRGYQVLELPPNTQGVATLEMLNIMEGFDLKALGHNSAAYLHALVEAKRIASADRRAWIGDPSTTPPQAVETMLSKDYATARRKEINPDKAADDYKPLSIAGLTPGGTDDPTGHGDTVYLTAADSDGNVISLIQSLYETFGSGIVAGDTGIVLQDRGSLFSLMPGPNQLAPGKRPFHTLIPAMVLKDGVPWLSFGVMGGDMQAQGHAQVLANLIDFGMNIQEAGEAPRFRDTGNGLALESPFSADARAGLTSRGHHIIGGHDSFGGFQGIMIDPKTHVLMAGSDPRKDGMAAGW